MGNFGDADKEFTYSNNPRWVVSKYGNHCMNCGVKIKPGDVVVWFPADEGVICRLCEKVYFVCSDEDGHFNGTNETLGW